MAVRPKITIQPQVIQRIAQRIQQMHSLPAVSFSFSPFTTEQEQMLLSAYFGSVDSAIIERTRRMKELFLLRDATWCLVQSCISDIGFNFLGYAEQLFTRLTSYLEEERTL